jgi:hypothetical protein
VAPPFWHLGLGREQRGEGEKKQETPPVREEQRGRGGCVKKREILRGFLQIAVASFISKG